jgi:hypothetical protein
MHALTVGITIFRRAPRHGREANNRGSIIPAAHILAHISRILADVAAVIAIVSTIIAAVHSAAASEPAHYQDEGRE